MKRSPPPPNAAARCAHCGALTPRRSREKRKKRIPTNCERQPSHFFTYSCCKQRRYIDHKVWWLEIAMRLSYYDVFFSGLREIGRALPAAHHHRVRLIVVVYKTDTCAIVRESLSRKSGRFTFSEQFTLSERLIDLGLGPVRRKENIER